MSKPYPKLHHEDLDAYKAAIEFLAVASGLIAEYPRGYGPLADQLKRASLSIPLNIPLEPVPWNDCKPWKYWMPRWLFLGKDCSEDGVVTTCNHVVLMEPVRVGISPRATASAA